jgi:hypothetical protein
MLRTLKSFFRFLAEYGKSPLQIEILRTKSALARYKRDLSEMVSETEDEELLCCCGCAFGTPYRKLCQKIERVSARLTQLQIKCQQNNLPR